MALTSPSTAVAAFDKGRLAAGISASDTTITVGPIYKTVNGVRTKQGFDSTSGECIISQGDYQERISFEGSSVNATTKITTLTTCTRGLPVTNTTANFTGGTGRPWSKGAYITVIDSASYNQSTPFKNTANTFTAVQTFNAQVNVASPLVVSGTSSYIKIPSMTEAQRDALTASNGIEVYVTDGTNANRIHTYEGGAWGVSSSTTVADMSTTAAGKGELATTAEHATGASTGGSGSPLVVPNSSLVKTSSGASDENKIPLLNADGALHINHIATGTPDGTKFVRDDGVLATPTASTPLKYANIVDSNTVGSTSSETDFNTNYTIPAGALTEGIVYQVKAHILYTQVAGSTQTVRVKMGSTTLLSFAGLNNGTNDSRMWELDAIIICRTTGASGTVYATGVLTLPTAATAASISRLSSYGSSTIDTTGTNVLKISDQPSDNQANTMIVKNIIINKLG